MQDNIEKTNSKIQVHNESIVRLVHYFKPLTNHAMKFSS